MNKVEEQKQALRDSIAHWERMRDDPECGERPDGEECPCCKKYALSDIEPADDCKGCPIFEYTGHNSCYETPYYNANGAFLSDIKNFPEAAQKEIDFLNKVLEEL